MRKERLDLLLIEKGLCESREKAKASIMAGLVFVDGVREDKPGTKIAENSQIEIRGNSNPYVSRGGLKLEKAINQFNISLENKVTIDIGASTGGFTDCMLQNGAKKVYAIDVGYGQLAWKLRTDNRVINMERTNIRYVEAGQLDEKADFASIDVSFISLKKVLPVTKQLLSESGEVLCLVKPQFEAGREKVGKRGVVRDSKVHEEVVNEIAVFALSLDFKIKGVTYSPIKGPEGNIEYLLYISLTEGMTNFEEIKGHVAKTVTDSHAKLNE